MAFDGLTLAAVGHELETKLVGGRIDRVYQPEKEVVLIHIRSQGANHHLLISAQATHARIHLTQQRWTNPATPPVFCMVLRKYLEGSRVTAIHQPGLERVLHLEVETADELFGPSRMLLVVEIMGKHSNILLLDPKEMKIIDGIKRYSHELSRYREVLPGRPYLPPPSQEKVDLLNLDEERFRTALLQQPWELELPQALLRLLDGLGPENCREVVSRADLQLDTRVESCGEYELARLWQELQQLAVRLRQQTWLPTMVLKNGQPFAYGVIPLSQYTGMEQQQLPSVNAVIDSYYSLRLQQDRFSSRQQALHKLIRNQLAHQAQLQDKQHQLVAQAQDADQHRIAGELITANLYRLQRGASQLEAENYYQPGSLMTIPLDPARSPADNAQAYFKRYRKARNGGQVAATRLQEQQAESDYLESVRQELEQAETVDDLVAIRSELVRTGYLREQPQRNRSQSQKPAPPSPRRFISSDGLEILVGKNNLQNDHLSLRLAQEHDLWLHVKDQPGSHVVIRLPQGGELPEQTLKEAAQLAASFSKAANSSQVPIDYTRCAHVRKPRGARPGKVIYDHHQTIYVNPDAELAQRLQADLQAAGD